MVGADQSAPPPPPPRKWGSSGLQAVKRSASDRPKDCIQGANAVTGDWKSNRGTRLGGHETVGGLVVADRRHGRINQRGAGFACPWGRGGGGSHKGWLGSEWYNWCPVPCLSYDLRLLIDHLWQGVGEGGGAGWWVRVESLSDGGKGGGGRCPWLMAGEGGAGGGGVPLPLYISATIVSASGCTGSGVQRGKWERLGRWGPGGGVGPCRSAAWTRHRSDNRERTDTAGHPPHPAPPPFAYGLCGRARATRRPKASRRRTPSACRAPWSSADGRGCGLHRATAA